MDDTIEMLQRSTEDPVAMIDGLKLLTSAATAADLNNVLKFLEDWLGTAAIASVAAIGGELVQLAAVAKERGASVDQVCQFGKALVAVYDREDAPSEGNVFAQPALIEIVPQEILSDQFERWVTRCCAKLPEKQLNAFVNSLPKSPAFFPDWPWRLFDLLEKRGVAALLAIPDVTSLPRATSDQYGRLWAFLWDLQAFEILSRYAGTIADSFQILSARRMQISALIGLGDFSTVKTIFATAEINSLRPDEQDWMARSILADAFTLATDPDQRLSRLQALPFLPLADRSKLQREYRKLFRDHLESLEGSRALSWACELPDALSFDPGWPIYRLLTLFNRGVLVDETLVANSLSGLDENVELPSDVILSLCKFLSARGDMARLREWSEYGLARSSHPRLLLFHARSCLVSGEPEQGIASAEKLLESHPKLPEAVREMELIKFAVQNQTTEPPLIDFQHVCISGVSYCGSTLLARVLGGLQGVENIGESHWLIERKEEGRVVSVDFQNDEYEKQVQCFSCGPECPYLTRSFREQLQADPVNWYHKIAARLRCRTLVSADKNYAKITAKDPLLRLDSIVLFKSPVQAWYSNFKRMNAASGTSTPVSDLNEYMRVWARSYQKFIQEFDVKGDKLYLNFDAFCDEPKFHLQRLCQILGLHFDASALSRIDRAQHYIGGNSQVNQRLRISDKAFVVRRLEEPLLPEDHLAAIDACAEVNQVYEQLMMQYRRDFGIVEQSVYRDIQTVLEKFARSQQVLDSKRTMFFNSAHDAERNLRIRLRSLRNDPETSKEKISFFEQSLQTIDFQAYRKLQAKYLDAGSIAFHQGFIKYLNLDYWLAAKYDLAVQIGLNQGSGLNILDIGTGPGHFPFACRMMGHRAVGTDIELPTSRLWNHPHIYDALVEFFAVDRLQNRVAAFRKLPAFKEKFDLVTAFLVKFNIAEDNYVWGIKEWAFFLKDVANNVLAENGRLYLKMNATGRDTTKKYVDEELYNFMRDKGAKIDLIGHTVLFDRLDSIR